jgi:hypothetical protein
MTTLTSKLNGTGDRFDKLMRRDELRKADESLRVLKRLAPEIARTVEEVDAKFAALIDKLEKIEAAHQAHSKSPPTLAPGREPSGDEVLEAMRFMTPAARDALMMKLKLKQ